MGSRGFGTMAINHRNSDILRFKLVVPKGKQIFATTLKGRKIYMPSGIEIDYQCFRDQSEGTVNLDQFGLLYVDPKKIDPKWLKPINRLSLTWHEAKFIGGTWENQPYTQQNTSTPIHAKSMWYEK